MTIRTLLICAFGLAFLYGLFTVGAPFLVALIIAISIEPLVKLLMRTLRLNRLMASTAACTFFTVGMLGIMYLIGLKIINQFLVFLNNLPGYLDNANRYINDSFDQWYDKLPVEVTAKLEQSGDLGINALFNSLNGLLNNITHSALNFAALIPNLFILFIVFLVALFLFSASLHTMKDSFLSLFHESARDKVGLVLDKLKGTIFGFMKAQLILSGLTYIVSLTGLIILNVNFAMAIALLIIIVDVLPVLGTGSVLVPWAIYSFVVNDNAKLGIGLFILFLVITVFRRIVEPKILGDSIGIGPISTLISLVIGFQLAGIAGLFLGPIVIIIYQTMREVGLLEIKIKFDEPSK